MAEIYYLPLRFAYENSTHFWELVFCYGNEKREFELTEAEFIFADSVLMDRDTFKKYINSACALKVILQITNEENSVFRLNDIPKPVDSVPKPRDFILNDWVHRLLSFNSIGRRALWLLNFLIRTRWEDLSFCLFNPLKDNLQRQPFSYDLPKLKESIDAVRSRKTEAPKESLQLLWKLGIVIPVNPDSFKFPQKGQTWDFTLKLEAFKEDAFRQIETEHIPLISLDVACRILSSWRRQLEEAGYNPALRPASYKLEALIVMVGRVLAKQNLGLPTEVELRTLVEDFCQTLINQDIIKLTSDGELLLKSPVLSNRQEMAPLKRYVVRKHLQPFKQRQLIDAMKPFMLHRNRALADMVLNLGIEFEISPPTCVNLFQYLQMHTEYFPQDMYESFKTYCEKHISLIQFGIGFRDIFDGFAGIHSLRPKLPRTIKRIEKEVLLNELEKHVFFDIPLSARTLTWARMRRILSLHDPSSIRGLESTRVELELWGSPKQLIFQESVVVLELRKEELPPTPDLSDKIQEIQVPLLVRFILPCAMPHLTVNIVFEWSQ